MKKFYLFCVIILLISIFPLKSQNLYDIFSYKNNLSVNFYVNKVFAENLACKVIINGNGAIVSCNSKNSKIIDSQLTDKYGESVKFNGNMTDFNDAILTINGKILQVEQFDDEKVAYGYSNLLGRSVLIDGKNVNFQIAMRDDLIVIGTPLIFGSF